MKTRITILATSFLLLLTALPLAAAKHSTAEVSAALKAYRQALVSKDLVALEKVWVDDYTFIDSHGRIRTKTDRLNDLKTSATKLDSITHENEPRIQIHGDVAIILSDVTIVGRYGDREVTSDLRSTLVWRWVNGRWRLQMNQLTAIDE
jgi:ketosteroid isomerase-like protein